MPSGPMAHICLLVRDLDRAVEDWTKLLQALDPGQLEQQIVRYDDFEGGDDDMRWATFVSDHGAEIQLMQPADETPLARRLNKHGEGRPPHLLHDRRPCGRLAAARRRGPQRL